jgi:hypothetical protein
MKIQYLYRLKIYNVRVCRLLSTCSLLLSSRCCRCCSCCHCCRHHRRHCQVFVAASLYRYLLICDRCHHWSSLSPIHANPLLPYITASSPCSRLLITVWRRYCFWGQIHSIPGYWSIPQYSWSNVFQFCSCRGSKNRYCFWPEDSNIYYCFHRNTVFSIPVNLTGFLSIPEYYCLRM